MHRNCSFEELPLATSKHKDAATIYISRDIGKTDPFGVTELIWPLPIQIPTQFLGGAGYKVTVEHFELLTRFNGGVPAYIADPNYWDINQPTIPMQGFDLLLTNQTPTTDEKNAPQCYLAPLKTDFVYSRDTGQHEYKLTNIDKSTFTGFAGSFYFDLHAQNHYTAADNQVNGNSPLLIPLYQFPVDFIRSIRLKLRIERN